ncbi:MAG TPA: NAD(P)H-hydrate dehydratase [Gammaproteobacteria bacterium]
MNGLPSKLYHTAQIRQLEQLAIDEFAIPATQLMERAGHAAFEVLRKRWPWCRNIVVVCGSGNNGGDGFVVARLARQAGLAVRVAAVGTSRGLKGEAAAAMKRAASAGVEIRPFEASSLEGAELVVDGLLGTGLSGTVGEEHLAAITAVNQAGRPVLALDLPSGIHADTGRVLGSAVNATLTLTFVGMKQGFFTGEAPDHCGLIELATLGIPDEAYQSLTPAASLFDFEKVAPLLQPRRRASHKGMFGHLLVVGGEHGMLGAAQLAARAAGRTGAGLVSLATRESHAPLVGAVAPEVMAHSVESAGDLAPLLARSSVVALGPGLGQGAWGRALFGHLVECRLPMVVDADGLNLLANNPLCRDDWVLTPHPGEAARLLGCSSSDIQADRFAAVAAIAERYGGVCVLKGTGTLLQRSGQTPSLCNGGNPGMASGGMGDLLTGVIAALIAQGFALDEAARLGVAMHAAAGDTAARQGGERGMLASDLLPRLRTLANPVAQPK